MAQWPNPRDRDLGENGGGGGGGKGADTVKIVFQLCNVPSPNSVQNTCVFAVFEGRDTATNLHVALDRYKPQLEHLSAMEWRYIHVFK